MRKPVDSHLEALLLLSNKTCDLGAQQHLFVQDTQGKTFISYYYILKPRLMFIANAFTAIIAANTANFSNSILFLMQYEYF